MVSVNVFDDLKEVGVKGHLTKVRRQVLNKKFEKVLKTVQGKDKDYLDISNIQS